MKLLITCILTCVVGHIHAQDTKIDSLKNLLNNASNDQQKLTLLSSLSKELISNGDPKTSLPFFEELASLANMQDSTQQQFTAYRYISESYMKLNDSAKAYEYAKKTLGIKDDVESYLMGVNQLGRAYDHFENYKKAVETYEQGIDYYEKEGEQQKSMAIPKIFLNQSQALKQLGQSEKAIESMLKGLDYAERIDDSTGIAFGLYNIGYYYMSLEDYEKAETYLLKSLTYADKVDLPIYVNANHHALGINYSRWEKFDKAIEHNKIALENFRKAGNDIYVFDVLNNTAVVYSRMENFDKAGEFAKKALVMAEKLNHKKAILGAKHTLVRAYLMQDRPQEAEKLLKDIIKDTLTPNAIVIESKRALFEDLSAAYEMQDKHKLALKYYKRYNHITDSLSDIEKTDQFAEIETRYQVEKKDKENLLLQTDRASQELQLQKASTIKWSLLLILLAIAIILMVLWRRYHIEAKAKRMITEQKDEIEKQKRFVEMLQQELHHRMKNNLAVVDLFINLAKDKFPDKAYQEKLNELQNRMRSMFEVHRQLFKKPDITFVGAKQYVETLTDNIKASFPESPISIVNSIDQKEHLNANTSFPVGLIVNEFVTNSFKYAFDEPDKGVISIDLNSDTDNYFLRLSDNGKGLPKGLDLEKINTFGLESLQLLTKEYNGQLHIDGTNGVTVTVTLPKLAA